MKRGQSRLQLGSSALLSVAVAAELLPMRDSEARALIEGAGIVRHLGGRRVVLWADCIALACPADSIPAPARMSRLRRAKLS